ncbi:MAG: acylphosphatase [Burkholderiaceae bacterium]|nr:MAG: acylphosphatase [Burkholderiaceae bacterium]
MDSRDKEVVIESWLVQVCGHVQGVGYREACVRHARAQGITGWVRNRLDGSVELMLQGSRERLAYMCSWLRDGISAAVVDELEVMQVQPPLPRFDHFERLPTL